MADKKDERKTVVPGPRYRFTHPEKRAERDKQKAFQEERFRVLQLTQQIGTYFSATMVTAGALLLGVLAYVVVARAPLISPEMPFLSFVVWVFAGIANVVGGLLLIGSK
jgi:hypothetical protein